MVTAERVDYLLHKDSFGTAPLFPWVWQAYLARHHYGILPVPPVAETLRAMQALLTTPDPVVITLDPVVARATVANVTLSVGAPASSSSYPTDLRRKFAALAKEWREGTGLLSSPSQIAMHPAYLRIISMGASVVPFILKDLQRHGGQWYLALRAITGASPVPEGARHTSREVRDIWLQWGRDNGYLN